MENLNEKLVEIRVQRLLEEERSTHRDVVRKLERENQRLRQHQRELEDILEEESTKNSASRVDSKEYANLKLKVIQLQAQLESATVNQRDGGVAEKEGEKQKRKENEKEKEKKDTDNDVDEDKATESEEIQFWKKRCEGLETRLAASLRQQLQTQSEIGMASPRQSSIGDATLQSPRGTSDSDGQDSATDQGWKVLVKRLRTRLEESERREAELQAALMEAQVQRGASR